MKLSALQRKKKTEKQQSSAAAEFLSKRNKDEDVEERGEEQPLHQQLQLSSSSSRRRRGRTAAAEAETVPTAIFRLPEESDVEETPDVLPSHVNLSGNVPDYVRESDDFQLVSRWISGLPRSGRSLYERAVRGEVLPSAIAGGTTCICFGEGEAETGPIGVNNFGLAIDWTASMEQRMREREATTNWEGRRISETLPSELSRCFARYREECQAWVHGTGRSPRSIWRATSLPRTSVSRCVACLAQELQTRAETRVTIEHYVNSVRDEETERWRRMRPSTRILVFRQHSCHFGEVRESRWHGLVTSIQRDVLGGVRGWLINFRVYVSAAIPANHPGNISS